MIFSLAMVLQAYFLYSSTRWPIVRLEPASSTQPNSTTATTPGTSPASTPSMANASIMLPNASATSPCIFFMSEAVDQGGCAVFSTSCTDSRAADFCQQHSQALRVAGREFVAAVLLAGLGVLVAFGACFFGKDMVLGVSYSLLADLLASAIAGALALSATVRLYTAQRSSPVDLDMAGFHLLVAMSVTGLWLATIKGLAILISIAFLLAVGTLGSITTLLGALHRALCRALAGSKQDIEAQALEFDDSELL